jgi:hypothetical protein
VQNIACHSTLSRDVDAELEDEIAKIESSADASAEDKSRLADLKKELETIMKKKEDYVAEHPEQRRLVYRGRKTDAPQGEKSGEAPKPQTKRNVFDKNGMPRHPERSIYYDPVLNPYGVAPPGMPYMERGQSIRWCARDAGLKPQLQPCCRAKAATRTTMLLVALHVEPLQLSLMWACRLG